MERQTSTFDILGRARLGLSRQEDPAASGRPVSLMVGGGLLAVVSMTLCLLLARQIWLTGEVAQEPGLYGVSLLFVLFVGGVYVFALGYELNDVGRAVRLTLILAVLGLAGLVLVVSVFVVLAWLKAGAGSAAPGRQARGVLGLMSGFDSAEEEEPQRHTLAFSVQCPKCEYAFIPIPPAAVCPWCDTAYFPEQVR